MTAVTLATVIVDNVTAVSMDDDVTGGTRCDSWSTERVVRGLVTPFAVLLTAVTNSLVCLVLLQPAMRNVTNALLVALAAADTLTGLCPLPHYFRSYTIGVELGGVERRREWSTPIASTTWCALEPGLTEFLPTAFHTASIWLTVALAVHRSV